MFPLKTNLDHLIEDPLEPKDKRRSFREKGGSANKVEKDILPAKCIFCRKEKYVKNSITREKVNSCTQFCADDKVRKASILKDHTQILAICTGELIAKEAKYHVPCYRSYTLILYKHENRVAEQNDTVFDKAYKVVKVILQDLVYPTINTKSQYFENLYKKKPGDIMILHKCTKNHDHMLYCS